MSEQNKSKCDFGFKPAASFSASVILFPLNQQYLNFSLNYSWYSYLNSWIVALCPTLYQRRVSNMEPPCHRDHLLIYGWLRQNLFWDNTQSGRSIPSAHLTAGGKQPLPSAYMRHEQTPLTVRKNLIDEGYFNVAKIQSRSLSKPLSQSNQCIVV